MKLLILSIVYSSQTPCQTYSLHSPYLNFYYFTAKISRINHSHYVIFDKNCLYCELFPIKPNTIFSMRVTSKLLATAV